MGPLTTHSGKISFTLRITKIYQMTLTTKLFTTLLLTPIISYAGKNSCPTHLPCDTNTAHSGHDHDTVIPVGIMGGHMHEAGEWMFSYRYMFMNMDGLRQGRDSISSAGAHAQGYIMAPEDMQMQMHMLGAMYAPTDNLTLMAMVNYISNDMTMVNPMGVRAEMNSEGFGDLSIGALFKLYETEASSLHAGINVIAPTGSTDETGTMMAGMTPITLPYGMQLGSGTWGLKPSLSYLGQEGNLSWGAQATATIYLGENDNDYRLGNRIEGNLWAGYQFSESFSTTLRFSAQSWGSITGEHDEILNRFMSTLTDTANSGGQRVDAFIGAAYQFSAFTASAEFGQTLWQDLEGIQLGYDWSLNLGVSAAF